MLHLQFMSHFSHGMIVCRSVKAADVNGDGFPDLLVGAPGYSERRSPQLGRVYLLLGTQTISSIMLHE